jgi:hypothetical protein
MDSSKPALPPGTVSGHDRSSDPTVVEYAVQDLFKGKSLKAAANHTAKKLSGHENMFLGPGVTVVDPKKLEAALWDRMAERAAKGVAKYAEDKNHFVLGGTLQFYMQTPFGQPDKPAMRKRLKELVIEKLGRDPFLFDDGS